MWVQNFKSGRCAGYAAMAIGAALPWSTSATAALIVIWFLAYLPLFDASAIRREACSWHGSLPLLLFFFAALGMLWSQGTWVERFAGLRQFDKLLFVPLAIAYFRQSEYGPSVLLAFAISCTILLLVALTITIWPELQWWRSRYPGVPVKHYITQSALFASCAFGILYIGLANWRHKDYFRATALILLASAFLGDILFVISSRTQLLVISVLVVLLCIRGFGLRGLAVGIGVLTVGVLIVWNTSEYVRGRIFETQWDIHAYLADGRHSDQPASSSKEISSTAYRLEFLRRSVEIIRSAPLAGHGTGSVRSLFAETATGKSGVAATVTERPHNQIASVAIQLGVIGAVLLCAMWAAHALMFTGEGSMPWFGQVLVAQIVVGSLFNDHLFEFTEGWLYVCGIGVIGGTYLRRVDGRAAHTEPSTSKSLSQSKISDGLNWTCDKSRHTQSFWRLPGS